MTNIIEKIKRAITIENKVALINHSCHEIAKYGSYEAVAREFGTSLENVKFLIRSGGIFKSGYRIVKAKDVFKMRKNWLYKRQKRINRYQRKLDYDFGDDNVTKKHKMDQFLLNLR